MGREEQLERIEFLLRYSEGPGSAALYSHKSQFRQTLTSPSRCFIRFVPQTDNLHRIDRVQGGLGD